MKHNRKASKFNANTAVKNADKWLEDCKGLASRMDKKRLLRLRTFIDTRLNTLYGVDEIGYL